MAVPITVQAGARIIDVRTVDGVRSQSLRNAACRAVNQVGRSRPLPETTAAPSLNLRVAMKFRMR